MASTEYTVELNEITATVVPESARMAVLPNHFGMRYMMVGENLVYSQMRALVPAYTGALWDFYELSNGGFFMAPRGEERYTVEVRGNGYEGSMSAEAAGITACLFAFGQLANQSVQAHIIDLYHQLREYACRHFESGAILAAID